MGEKTRDAVSESLSTHPDLVSQKLLETEADKWFFCMLIVQGGLFSPSSSCVSGIDHLQHP